MSTDLGMNTDLKVLVIGGNGFIGRHVALRLLTEGFEVVIGTRDAARGAHPALPKNLPLRKLRMERMQDADDWEPCLAGFDLIVNAVGILRQRGEETYDRVHHRGPAALAEACRRFAVPLLHVSALGLRNPARSRFLGSKLKGEQALLRSGARICIVRPSLLDGEGGYGAAWVRRVGRWPVQFHPANAEGLVECCCVMELAEAMAVLAKGLVQGDPSVPCMAELGGTRREDIATHLARRYHALHAREPLRIAIPGWVARGFAHLFDLLHFSPYSFGHYELLRFDNCAQPNRMAELLGRPPRDVVSEPTIRSEAPTCAVIRPTRQIPVRN